MSVIIFKGCVRCAGDMRLALEPDVVEGEVVCVQCGHRMVAVGRVVA